jgi:hypothetical protein
MQSRRRRKSAADTMDLMHAIDSSRVLLPVRPKIDGYACVLRCVR